MKCRISTDFEWIRATRFCIADCRTLLAGLLVVLCVCLMPGPVAYGQSLDVVRDYDRRATQAWVRGDDAEAERLFRDGISAAQKMKQPTLECATMRRSLATILVCADKPALAEKELKSAIELIPSIKKVDRSSSVDSTHSSCLHMLAVALQDLRRYDEAEAAFVESLDLTKRSVRPDTFSIVSTSEALATLYEKQARFEDAEQPLISALEVLREVDRRDLKETSQVALHLVQIYDEQEKYAVAEQLMDVLFADIKALNLESSPAETRMLSILATHYTEACRLPEAEATYLQILTNLKEHGLDFSASFAELEEYGLANVYVLQGKNSAARSIYERRLKTHANPPDDNPEKAMHDLEFTRTCSVHLGELELAERRFDKAEKHFRTAILVHQKRWNTTESNFIGDRLATVLSIQGKTKEADKEYSRFLKAAQQDARENRSQKARRHALAAQRVEQSGQLRVAESIYQKSFWAYEQTYGLQSPQCGQLYELKARNLMKQSRPEEAKVYQDRAAAIRRLAQET